MSHVDSHAAPAPPPAERELTVAPDGAPRATVRLLNTAIGLLAAQIEALRQRNAGQPAAFFTRWAAWRAEWDAFASRHAQQSADQPMSAEERARLRRYAEQYESVREGVLQALALPWQRSAQQRPTDTGGWPWWLWALLLGGGATAAYYATRSRS